MWYLGLGLIALIALLVAKGGNAKGLAHAEMFSPHGNDKVSVIFTELGHGPIKFGSFLTYETASHAVDASSFHGTYQYFSLEDGHLMDIQYK